MTPTTFPSSSKGLPVSAAEVRPHLLRMRLACGLMFILIVAAAIAIFRLPRLRSTFLDPTPLTILTAAVAVWIGFTANRDARSRLERIKRRFAAQADVKTLLRGHLTVYLVVLVRLMLVAACGLIVAVWGEGPGLGVFFLLLAAMLVLMTWPTEHKTLLLIRRAVDLHSG